MNRVVKKYQKELRCGITTGTCAAAACKAAVEKLLFENVADEVTIHTVKGGDVSVPVFDCNRDDTKTPDCAEFMVIKDSGDDPDVTNQCEVHVQVFKLEREQEDMLCDWLEQESSSKSVPDRNYFTEETAPHIFLFGGVGIGTVTRDGLEQKVGQPAINVTPRHMILSVAKELCDLAEYEGYLKIVVSIPNGEELAKRTFNARLGIEGGLSILGTTGIIEPMSERAIIDTIEAQIRQLSIQGVKHLLVTPGNYGQGYVQNYMGCSLENSIKCSNYIGDTMDLAISYGMESLVLVGNVGKLAKLAAGIMNTHSKVADGRCEVFATHAALCGASVLQLEEIMNSVTTEEILVKLQEWHLFDEVMERICQKIEEVLEHRIGGKMQFGVYVFSEKLGFVGKTKGADQAFSLWKENS